MSELSRKEFYAKWVEGNDDIDMDLKFAVQEKSDTFNVRTDIKVLKQLADAYEASRTVQMTMSGITQKDIDYDELQLLLKRCTHDRDSLTTWQSKCQDNEANAYQALQEFRQRQDSNAGEAATLLMKRRLSFLVWDEDDAKNLNHIMDHRRSLANHTLNRPTHEIPLVGLLNHAAPCVFVDAVKKAQFAALAWSVSENLMNVGLVTMPTFSHQCNKLYMLETNMLQKLSKYNFMLDTSFSIMFNAKSDKRDNRPMMYPGRFTFPAALGDARKSIWWASELRENGRTAPAPQLPSKDMVVPEDISDDAVPATADTRYVSAGPKYCQLGPDAAHALLESLTLGMDFVQLKISGLVFVNLTPNVGDEVYAFLNLQKGSSLTSSMICFCSTQCEKDWLETSVKEWIKDKVKSKDMVVPGQIPIEDAPSRDNVGQYAPMPSFNVLVPKGTIPKYPGSTESGCVLPKDVVLEMPLAEAKKWSAHATHSNEFNLWMEQSGVNVFTPPCDSEGGVKRPGDPSAGAATKKSKVVVDPARIVPTSEIKSALLFECAITGITKGDPIKLHLRHKEKYMVNTGAAETAIPRFSILSGFGKGSFKLVKADSDLPANGIEFVLVDHNCWVIIGGVVRTLGDVINEERVKKPDIQPVYHKIEVDAAKPSEFKCVQTHRVAYVPQDDGTKLPKDGNIAAKDADASKWVGNGVSALAWSVRWTAKGLQAVAPKIILVCDVLLPPGKACAFQPVSE